MRLEEIFSMHLEKLNKTDFSILNYVISNKDNVVNMSLEELAAETYVSTASLVRCAQKLGFTGFSEFRYFIKGELSQKDSSTKKNSSLLKQDVSDTIKLISQTNLDPLCEALNKAGKIFVYGTDWGERIAAEMLTRNFLACDIPIYTIPSVTEFKWSMQNLTSDDLVIIISFRGQSSSIKSIVGELKTREIPFISITQFSKNILSSQADFNLYYKFTILNSNDTKNDHADKEHNLFSSLYVLVEIFFSYYYDNFYIENH